MIPRSAPNRCDPVCRHLQPGVDPELNFEETGSKIIQNVFCFYKYSRDVALEFGPVYAPKHIIKF